jgi:signal transduction histidine kinase
MADVHKHESVTRHDLRTPLTAILGFAELLEMEEGLTPGQLEAVREIKAAGRRLLTMIDALHLDEAC